MNPRTMPKDSSETAARGDGLFDQPRSFEAEARHVAHGVAAGSANPDHPNIRSDRVHESADIRPAVGA